MPKIHLNAFSGQMPRMEPHLLQPSQAQIAENCRFDSGAIVPLLQPSLVASLGTTDYRSIFNIDGTWFKSTDVLKVCRAPVLNDEHRFFYTGTAPRKSNKTLFAVGNYYSMGVPRPETALTVNVHTDPEQPDPPDAQDDVSYVYTFVTGWGEEGPPSPATALFQLDEGEYVTLTGIDLPSGYSSTYNIIGLRLYRISHGKTGSDYQEVYTPEWIESDVTGGHIPVAETTLTDRNGTAYEMIPQADLGAVLETESFQPPPNNLNGLVLMSNGVMAGFSGNGIYLTEPFLPYAYPPEYELATDYAVVALAAYDTTLVALTNGYPHVINCYDPKSATQYRIPEAYPCVNAGGVAAGHGFVAYVSPYGLIRVNNDGLVNLTKTAGLFNEHQWQALTPANMLLFFYNERFYVFDYGLPTGFVLDFSGESASYAPFELTDSVYAGVVNPDGFFLLTKTGTQYSIKKWEGGSTSMTATFKTKRFILPRPLNYVWACVKSTFDSNVTFRLYGDETLIYTKTVSSKDAFLLPGGSKYQKVEASVETTSKVTEIILATSMQELLS